MAAADATLITFQAVVNILLMCSVGVVLARRGLCPPPFRQTLTQVVVYVFTPSLLIVKVASTISLDRFWQWWPLPVFALCLVGIGCTLGAVVGVAFRLPPTQRRLVMAALSFKNNQSIPLALVPALAGSLPQLLSGPTDTPADAATRAAGYVLFFTAIVSALRWTVGAFLMRPPASAPDRPDDAVPLAPLNGTAANGATDAAAPNGSATDAAPKDEEHVGLMLDPGEPGDEDGDGDGDGGAPAAAPTVPRWRRWWAACYRRVASVLSPPLVAVIIAVFIGLIEPLQQLFFGEDAPLKMTVTAALTGFGACTVPCILLTLGAQLSRGPDHRRQSDQPYDYLGPWVYVVTIFASLVVCGLVGMGVVYATTLALPATALLAQDPVMQLTLMVEAAAPSAINLMTLANRERHLQQSLANLLFYQYLLATLSLTASVPIFLLVCHSSAAAP